MHSSSRRAARALQPSMHASRGRLSSSCRAADECSPAYVTNAQDLADASQDTECDVLYVVGGLYGNVAALDALEEGIARERRHGLHIEVCFNGDFNFFNATSKTWARINQGVRALGHATAGNVEREALKSDGGCGCAYPDYVDGAFADRASAIVERLRTVSSADPDIVEWLAGLPLSKTYAVGGVRVCCVHGHHAVSKSKLDTRRWRRGGAFYRPALIALMRVDGVRVSSTPPPRRRRGGAQRQRDTRRWRGGHEPGERQKQLTKHRRPGLRERLGPLGRPPAGRVPAGTRDGHHKNRTVVRGSDGRRLRLRAHVPVRAPEI